MRSIELLEERDEQRTVHDPTQLHLDLQTAGGIESSRVSFLTEAGRSRVRIFIGRESYTIELDRDVCANPPGALAMSGVTVLTGRVVDESSGGYILIEVNCGQEPPTLQIATRMASGDVRAWSWVISHDIQHRILQVFAR
jgi:hypothetical protein